MIRDGEYRLRGWRMMYQQFSYSVCDVLLASAVGLLALLPLLVVDAKSFLSNIFECLCVHGNRSLGNDLGHRIGMLCAPILNDLVLVTRRNPDILVVHQPVSRHADNEERGGSQDCDQGVSARVREKSFSKAVVVHFL
jgi:hypothetical protein